MLYFVRIILNQKLNYTARTSNHHSIRWHVFRNNCFAAYYGTSSYSSFNDSNYLRFLTAVEALPSNLETDTRWVVGLAGNFIPSIFTGEKYALVDDPDRRRRLRHGAAVYAQGARRDGPPAGRCHSAERGGATTMKGWTLRARGLDEPHGSCGDG